MTTTSQPMLLITADHYGEIQRRLALRDGARESLMDRNAIKFMLQQHPQAHRLATSLFDRRLSELTKKELADILCTLLYNPEDVASLIEFGDQDIPGWNEGN